MASPTSFEDGKRSLESGRRSERADHGLSRRGALALGAATLASPWLESALAQAVVGDDEPLNENLFRSVEELELSVRSANCLQNANITLIGELVQRSEQDMLKTKNFGRKSLKEIKEILQNMGLTLGMKIDNWPQLIERWKAQQAQA